MSAHVVVKDSICLVFMYILDRLRILRKRSGIIFLMVNKRKNPYAVALGRKGGKKGGPARAANMTPEQRSESARNAVMARWAKAKRNPSAADRIGGTSNR